MPSARRTRSTSCSRRGIGVANFSLGQPSLDEVFLALTGHTAEDQTEDDESTAIEEPAA